MTFTPLGALDTARFLSEYWQKKPSIIRRAFKDDVQADFDANDLAGLACEPLAESRLITGSYPAHDWTVQYGPFSEETFQSLPEDNWTLLVQDVEKHYPPLSALIEGFDFLPGWRLDDLMISFSVQGGSVGPHVDQYDVFLIQFGGQKRWQIAQDYDPELVEDSELKVLQSFTSEQEWLLEPGDMLYLPPGIAHYGLAVEPGMTWSVGLRAPSVSDMLHACADWLEQHADEGGRYSDPALDVHHRVGEINAAAINRSGQMLLDTFSDQTQLAEFFISFISRYRLAHEPAAPEQSLSDQQISELLSANHPLSRNPWTRMVWYNDNQNQAVLYVCGNRFTCLPELAEALCARGRIDLNGIDLNKPDIQLITTLHNQGHIYFSQDSD